MNHIATSRALIPNYSLLIMGDNNVDGDSSRVDGDGDGVNGDGDGIDGDGSGSNSPSR
jgi:hypothetical protein